MFRPISRQLSQATDQPSNPLDLIIEFTFDGRLMRARNGDTLAASLLANGVNAFRRTSISGTERGPYCLMGVCFDCLVVVDGIGNRQACLTPVRQGMVVEPQRGARTVDALENTDQ
ncbi:2Fe-2S iron-sulfur cluster protein [Phyllobacterium myrsinacearum]|jgi:D-hydroxyproline dehydrogenase subunit gamma|uniref:(2Fe-2S)-binding protein n=2 Tax=Phyllobacterium myrsinacearum TaxID=28101 RepID=A0A2S9JGP7_9HYPH|nr:(2Fe-2S)-binding protein [Phyllobacterium myrsinacearum]PWV83795.1 2Fe-2S iron-sulfur cluster protein [Phyllobacterium myrsinacearum]RZV04685.1 2Fe-2S iron-sulfur cluster protein [Phyllobacterium myrsinacearum]